jgi:predicted RNA-binding protein with PUA-like domain
MAFWLFKTEAGTFSWEDQLRAGTKGEEWTGVRNALAQKQMRGMKVGDLGFFYHSGDEKRIVGVVKVISGFHPDSTDRTGRWSCVDVAAVDTLPSPVSLAEIKADPRLADMVLVKNSRLSVQPVSEREWTLICSMAGFHTAPA